jgi:6-phosphofructo-2-kinase
MSDISSLRIVPNHSSIHKSTTTMPAEMQRSARDMVAETDRPSGEPRNTGIGPDRDILEVTEEAKGIPSISSCPVVDGVAWSSGADDASDPVSQEGRRNSSFNPNPQLTPGAQSAVGHQVDNSIPLSIFPITTDRLAIIFCGQPARGKTQISRRIARYLTFFHAVPCQVFNVAEYRRTHFGAGMGLFSL